MDSSAQDPPRDALGHFIHVDKSVAPLSPEHHDPLETYVHDQTSIHKTEKDELIDIHVGNPLKRITQLLEDIKKQKAFSFDIKGSLGVAGITLVLGAFGIFGGTKALCSKGTQTKIGYIRTLKFQEERDLSFWERVPLLSYLIPKSTQGRVILVEGNGNAVSIHGSAQNETISSAIPTIATGDFDSCSSTLTLQDGNNSLEPAQ